MPSERELSKSLFTRKGTTSLYMRHAKECFAHCHWLSESWATPSFRGRLRISWIFCRSCSASWACDVELKSPIRSSVNCKRAILSFGREDMFRSVTHMKGTLTVMSKAMVTVQSQVRGQLPFSQLELIQLSAFPSPPLSKRLPRQLLHRDDEGSSRNPGNTGDSRYYNASLLVSSIAGRSVSLSLEQNETQDAWNLVNNV